MEDMAYWENARPATRAHRDISGNPSASIEPVPRAVPRVRSGFTTGDRKRVATLFWEAFSPRMARVIGPKDTAIKLVAEIVDPSFAFCVRENNKVVAVAGYKTEVGGLMNGSVQAFARHFGWRGALWRLLLLGALQKRARADTLSMDGIFVSAEARGQGHGTNLLNAIKGEAVRRGLSHVCLHVSDTNTRARALYVREGFVPIRRHKLGPLARFYGFSSFEVMRYTRPAGGAALQHTR